jgi:DNA polymerase-3 subunit alpha
MMELELWTGVVPSEVLEDCHEILKDGKILVVKGAVEIDDYRSKEIGDAMFRMRVKEVKSSRPRALKKDSGGYFKSRKIRPIFT